LYTTYSSFGMTLSNLYASQCHIPGKRYNNFLKTRRNGFACLRLVLASGASGDLPELGASDPRLGIGLLRHHDGEADVPADGVLVAGFAGVNPGRVAGVALVGLEGVEVAGGPGGVGVPLVVQVLLGVLVVELAVVLAVVEVESGGHPGVLGRDEGGCGCHEGDGDDLGQLLRSRGCVCDREREREREEKKKTKKDLGQLNHASDETRNERVHGTLGISPHTQSMTKQGAGTSPSENQTCLGGGGGGRQPPYLPKLPW